jgi:beta-lactamase class A
MALFRKKEKEEEPLNKKKKNLESNSRTRSRRKKKDFEPWGKKERYWVLGVLLITILTSGILAMSARGWKLPGLPRISLPSFGSGTIIIEKKKGELDEAAKETIASFEEKTKDLSGVYGLYVVRLNSGDSYGIFQNETFQAASLIKLPVMAALYMEEEKGNLNMDDEYVLKDEDKVGGSGSLYGEPEGTVLTYENLVRYMGHESDNTAFNIAVKILGEEKVREVIQEIGMINTSYDDNETTPYDVGLFFKKLWEGEIVSKEARDKILGYLTDTIYEEWLAAGIPSDIDVAHKYGREVHVVNDAGIVFTDNPFVLVILSKGVVEREADQVFPELSKIIYNKEH